MSAAGMSASSAASPTPTTRLSNSTRALSLAALAVTFGLLAWATVNLYQTISKMAAFYVPMPVGDYWRVAQHLHDYQTWNLKVFWVPHNEHRIVFPEIVFALDMLLFRGREVFSLCVSFVCYAAAWIVLARTVFSDKNLSLGKRTDAVLLSAGIVFWQGVTLSIADPFLLQWTLMHLAVALSLLFLFRGQLALTILTAVIATYTSGNALVLWPLLVCLAFLLPVSKRFLASLALAGGLSIGLYFAGYQASSKADWSLVYRHPLYFIGFAASYVAMPFSAMKSPAFGVEFGLVCLAAAAFLFVLVWRKKLYQLAPGFILCGYYLFTLLTIVITAAGRIDLNDPNFGAAKVTRYLTVPLLNWGALLLLLLWLSGRLNWHFFTTKRLAFALGGLLLLGAYKLRIWTETNADLYASSQVGVMSLDAGLTDAQLIHRIFPSPEFVRFFLPDLKKQRLGIFHYRHENRLGATLRDFGPILSESAQGRIVSADPIEHGVEVIGWINPLDTRDPAPRILLANEKKIVVGFGQRPSAGFPLDLRSIPVPEKEGWIAFANLALPSQKLTAYALTHRGVIPIDGAVDIPTFSGVGQDEVGTPVPDISWVTRGKFGTRGVPTNPNFGWRPAQQIFSSWEGGDANTGQITGSFAVPASHCVVLPVLHGPSVAGVSAALWDAGTGKVIAVLPFKERDSFLWSLWRIPIGADVKGLKYVATDDGAGWGQWLAVSTPMQCK